ncbi:DUF3307 domain-containing protein [Vibrio rumoiensis]|uniref:DUF3307 domain-containing protein n=1 Tax=Vibrio rumoiensis TaxID=76258 RepID=UPI003AA9A2AB
MISNDANVLFLSLFLGHILGDFFLQPDSWVQDKLEKKLQSKYLVLHALLHGSLSAVIFAFLFWGKFNHPVIQLTSVFGVVSVSHWIIDAIKAYLHRSYIWFVVDQVFHVVILAILTYGVVYSNEMSAIIENAKNLNYMLILPIVISYALMLKPTSVLIGEVLSKWAGEVNNEDKNGEEKVGLEDAGKYIGYIERVLILTFVLTSQYSAIGFVLAAKSIFRMGDLKENGERKFTEYVMVGTLFSVTVALFCGLFLIYILGIK